jgi:hypothetical protein
MNFMNIWKKAFKAERIECTEAQGVDVLIILE